MPSGAGHQPIELLLAPVREALAADGYELAIQQLDSAALRLKVTATPSACEDCLVSASVLRDIVAGTLRAGGRDIDPSSISIALPTHNH